MAELRIHPVPRHGATDGARVVRRTPPRGRERWEEANRLGLLTVHGLVGTFAGAFILFNGTAQALTDHGAWYRPLTGTLALVGGAVLLLGLGLHRVFRLEVAGLVLLAVWDAVMCVGFLVAALQAQDLVITWPWEASAPAASTRLYPIPLYGGLFLMMCVHLLTLRPLRAARR